MDALVSKAGIIFAKTVGGVRYTDTHADEAERGITIKSTGISMRFDYDMKARGVGSTRTEEEIKQREDEIAVARGAQVNVQITENS